MRWAANFGGSRCTFRRSVSETRVNCALFFGKKRVREFFDVVSSYVTAMIHRFIKISSMALVLQKKKKGQGVCKKSVDDAGSFDDLIIWHVQKVIDPCIFCENMRLMPVWNGWNGHLGALWTEHLIFCKKISQIVS